MDIEEAKGQEIAKLQNALQEMQTQLQEAQAAIIHEREAAKIAIEQAPPVIKEVPVIDNTRVEQLTDQNHELEVPSRNYLQHFHLFVFSGLIIGAHLQEVITELKKKVEEFEQAYSKVEEESQARAREAEEAQLKASQLQETIERYLI